MLMLSDQLTSVSLNFDATALKDANIELYDIIINNTASVDLLRTLSNNYQDEGGKAIKHIRDAFQAGGNENKEAVAAAEYKNTLMTITAQTKASELTGCPN